MFPDYVLLGQLKEQIGVAFPSDSIVFRRPVGFLNYEEQIYSFTLENLPNAFFSGHADYAWDAHLDE